MLLYSLYSDTMILSEHGENFGRNKVESERHAIWSCLELAQGESQYLLESPCSPIVNDKVIHGQATTHLAHWVAFHRFLHMPGLITTVPLLHRCSYPANTLATFSTTEYSSYKLHCKDTDSDSDMAKKNKKQQTREPAESKKKPTVTTLSVEDAQGPVAEEQDNMLDTQEIDHDTQGAADGPVDMIPEQEEVQENVWDKYDKEEVVENSQDLQIAKNSEPPPAEPVPTTTKSKQKERGKSKSQEPAPEPVKEDKLWGSDATTGKKKKKGKKSKDEPPPPPTEPESKPEPGPVEQKEVQENIWNKEED